MSDEDSAWRRKIQAAERTLAHEQKQFDAASDKLQDLFTVVFTNPRKAVEQFRIDVRRKGLSETIARIEKQHSNNPFTGDYRLKGAGLEVLSDRRTVERAIEARSDIAPVFRDFESALDRKTQADLCLARLQRQREDADETRILDRTRDADWDRKDD